MENSGAPSGKPIIGVLPIHFDVPENYLPLATFVDTANQTRAVIDAFNREVFAGNLQFDIFVLPPEEGSFKTRLAVALLAAGGIVWSFAESDIGKAFIKGLTMHEPAHWAAIAGSLVRNQLIESKKDSQLVKVEEEPLRLRQQIETIIVTESAKSFLQKPETELSRIGIRPQTFRDAYEARNEFYKACLKDTNVHALGFDEEEHFPITRRDFVTLQVAVPPKEKEPDIEPWQVETILLKVTSPNWDREDRQRQWKARDPNSRDRFFRMDDEYFWRLVSEQAISPHIIDRILVQWAFIGDQRRHARVLKVLEYNGERIGEPLNDDALRAILGAYSLPEREPDLFDR